MPELPEVEVVKKSLEKKIQNLVIKKVKIKDEKLRYKLDKCEFSKLIGQKIKRIERRSKYLSKQNIVSRETLSKDAHFSLLEVASIKQLFFLCALKLIR